METNINVPQLIETIKTTISKVVPRGTVIEVKEKQNYFGGGKYLMIGFYPESKPVNGVRGQYPELFSLCLNFDDMELTTQMYGGCGGQIIYRNPDKNHPQEKYLALVGIKVPFRKPKPELKFIIPAIERFASNWVKLIRENKDQLAHQDYVNYDEFLNS